MTDNQKGLIFGAFVADALALGPHWIYDTDVIASNFIPVNGFTDPYAPYHTEKAAGDFTHYGDQALLLLEHVSTHKHLNLELFKDEWLHFIESHHMYLDHATKVSKSALSVPDALKGSDSNELGGLVREVGLFVLDYVTLDDMINAMHLTHTDTSLTDIAEFTYLLIKQIVSGQSPSTALDLLYPKAKPWIKEKIDKALQTVDENSVQTIKSIGQSCSSDYGFPAALHLIYKYEDDFREAMLQNVYAGGDSAARGMYVGMILGAYLGYDGLPADWLSSLNAKDQIDAALKKVTLDKK